MSPIFSDDEKKSVEMSKPVQPTRIELDIADITMRLRLFAATIEKLNGEADPVEFENLLKLFCMKRAKILQLFYKQIARSKVKQSLEHLKQLWGIKKELNDLSQLVAPRIMNDKKLFNKLWRE